MFRRMLAILVPVTLLVACSSASPTSQESQGATASSAASEEASGEPSAAESATESTGDGGVASAEVTIGSGSRAGTYTATLLNGGCARNYIGPNSFTVSSDQVEATGGFVGPQLTISDASGAASSTDQFVFGAPFDNYAETFELVPQAPDRGTGTATLDDRGNTATVTVEGTTADGIAISATIECHSIVSA
jgi:hypothetical protein